LSPRASALPLIFCKPALHNDALHDDEESGSSLPLFGEKHFPFVLRFTSYDLLRLAVVTADVSFPQLPEFAEICRKSRQRRKSLVEFPLKHRRPSSMAAQMQYQTSKDGTGSNSPDAVRAVLEMFKSRARSKGRVLRTGATPSMHRRSEAGSGTLLYFSKSLTPETRSPWMAQWKAKNAGRKRALRLSSKERRQLLLGGGLLLLGLLCLIYIVVRSGTLVPQGSIPITFRKT
jgi:hypothetical protein